MYTINRTSSTGNYKAKVVNITPLQDWRFQVEYYTDEGYLEKDVVSAKDLEEDKTLST
mgnify:CR=1 FL=1